MREFVGPLWQGLQYCWLQGLWWHGVGVEMMAVSVWCTWYCRCGVHGVVGVVSIVFSIWWPMMLSVWWPWYCRCCGRSGVGNHGCGCGIYFKTCKLYFDEILFELANFRGGYFVNQGIYDQNGLCQISNTRIERPYLNGPPQMHYIS